MAEIPFKSKPRPSEFRPKKKEVAAAVGDLLKALGYDLKGDLAKTPGRVASLWTDKLLTSHPKSPSELLSDAKMSSKSETPVCITKIGTFLVCPHHLTVATGETHIAYEPDGHLIGFGALDTLVQVCTSDLAFQENATELIAQSLHTHLGCKAVAVMMQATHPCHTLNHPRSHQSKITTWSGHGPKTRQQSLRRSLRDALLESNRN